MHQPTACRLRPAAEAWTTLVVLVLALGLLTGPSAGSASAQDRVTIHPADTGVALENPDMGWVFHHFDNTLRGYGAPLGPGYDGREFPGLTVAYLRLGWSYLEPREGQFNWSVVDTPAQRYIAAGKKIAFRITCYEGDDAQPYATPKWVRDAGAKGYDLGKCWEPDYDDPGSSGTCVHFSVDSATVGPTELF